MTRRLVNIMDPKPVIPVYIFDIDGTIADHTHRLHYIKAERPGGKDWASFHESLHLDPPIEPMCMLAQIMLSCSAPVIFLTGRMEHQRAKTQQWLAKHVRYGIPEFYHEGFSAPFPWLLMRPDGDYREDTAMKGEALDKINAFFAQNAPEFKVAMAFEDRPRVCDYWRSRGLVVAKIGDWQEVNQSPASEAWAEPRPAVDRGQ